MLSRVFARQLSSTAARASGHSKWSKIKHTKGAADKARSVVYVKFIREIESAVRLGGGSVDPEINSSLANALKRSKAAGLPKENIENALKRAAGAASRGGQSVTYQAMLSGKVPFIIECQSDNSTRTHHAIRDVLGKHGARFADVGYMFSKQGRVVVSGAAEREEQLLSLAIDHGADDVSPVPPEDGAEQTEAEWEVQLSPENVDEFTRAIASAEGLNAIESEVAQVCSVTAGEVEDALEKTQELVEALEELPDVLYVWTVDAE